MICDTKVYPLGRYTIRQQPHFDNPAFAQFLIFVGPRLIGKQFSVPSESDCDWLARAADAPAPYSNGKKIRGLRYSTGGYNSKNATPRR